jgi:DNA-binding NtrC family response regulator
MGASGPDRILFVDDEAGIRATLPVILKRHGFSVVVAETVSHALDQIRQQKFDLLLSDLNIQREGDGFEVVRAMREAHPECVNIILTGYPGIESAIEGIHQSIDDYILKPAEPDKLVALLAGKIAQRRPKARILSVSYDEILLRTREMLLRSQGYDVVSALGYADAQECCQEGGFDVFVLGHSIAYAEKQKLVETFRLVCPAPIISLRRNTGDQLVDGADYHIEPDPEPLMQLVARITSGEEDAPLQ